MADRAQKKTETRQRILDAASQRFRRDGYADTSVTEVMRDAGLTHGGFYAHFKNKEDLFDHAVRHATDTAGDWLEEQMRGKEGAKWIEAWVDMYLSDGHCQNPQAGCPMPSLLPEVVRSGNAASSAFTGGLERRLERLREYLPFDGEESDRRASAAYAHMAGALMLSRALPIERSASLRRDVAALVKSVLLGQSELPNASPEGEPS